MGCGQVCQAKKAAAAAAASAAAADRDAAKARAAADSASTGSSSASSTLVEIEGTVTTVTTVAMVLGVAASAGALIPSELFPLLGIARSNQLIAKSRAGGLITPVQVAVGVYMGLTIAQKVFNIVMPAVKMAAEICGIILLNFALLPQLLADIGLIILAITVGLAPILLNKAKNILMAIPVDINTVTTKQLIQTKTLIKSSQKDMKKAFTSSVSKITAPNMDHVCITHQDEINNYIQTHDAPYILSSMTNVDDLREHFITDFENGLSICKEAIIDMLVKELKSETINVLDIDDVDIQDVESKTKTKEFVDGMMNAEKKLQILQDGEILRRQFSVSGYVPTQDDEIFDDNDLSVAAANAMIANIEIELNKLSERGIKGTINVKNCCMTIMEEEVKKKKEATIAAREEIDYIDLVQELILENKNSFISSMENNLVGVNLLESISLDPKYEAAIENAFTVLKSNMDQTTTINNAAVIDTPSMIALRDLVVSNLNQAVNNLVITVNTDTSIDFEKSVCDSRDIFKSNLFSTIKESINKSEITLSSIPNYVDPYEFNKVVGLFMDELKKKLIEQTVKLLIDESLPCKSCKPCYDMTVSLTISAANSIQKFKDIMKERANIISSTPHDWTITGAQSIIDQKSYLIGLINNFLSQPNGDLNLTNEMVYALQAEQKEILKNTKIIVEAI